MNLGGVIHLNKTGICIVCGCIVILFLYVYSKTDRNESTTDKIKHVNLKDILKVAVSAAKSGGVQILSTNNAKVETKGKTKEGLNESVTSADLKSHCAMTGIIKGSFSMLNIVSEEKANCENYVLEDVTLSDENINDVKDNFVSPNDITVWIDPLDATKEYTEELYQYVTTMVCVAIKGEPVIGVIHKPYSKETYWGWVGNGKSAHLIAVMPEREKKIVLISRSHSGSEIHDMIKQKFPKYSITEAGGSGYKVLEVIKGRADVYIHKTNIKKWDICAGNAILNTVGGKMTTIAGQNISYDQKLSNINEGGLVAAVNNHDYYLKTLQG